MAQLSIIWDLDGVLVDSLALRIAGIADAASKVGVSLPNEMDLRRWLCKGPKNALRQMPGVPTSLQPFEAFCRRAAPQHLKTFPGIDKTTKQLQRMGIRQALVTSRTSTDTNRWLNLGNVPSVFDVHITGSDRYRSKPHPDGLFAAVEKLATSVNDCAYLGDTIEDGEACERAGMKFLLAGWGTPDAAEVLAYVKTETVMHSPSDVLTWVLERPTHGHV